MKEDFTKDFATGDSSTDDVQATLDVWVDGWSHSLNRVAFAVPDDEIEMNVDFKLEYNTNPKVTVPEAETIVDDIQAEIENLQDSFSDGDGDGESYLLDYGMSI